MNKNYQRTLSVIIAIAMLFTGAYMVTAQDVGAASKPKMVRSVSVYNVRVNTATVKWSKDKKNVKGYTIYRNGKAIKSVKASVTKIKESGLKPSTKYSYKIRAYNIVKKKQWYNKKTGKWQTKKPAKAYRGASRKMNTKVYGPSSKTVTVKTFPLSQLKLTYGGYTVDAAEVKAAGGQIKRDVKSSRCPKCGVCGYKVVFTYNGKELSARIAGNDYSKVCHHCDGVTVTGHCGDRWFTERGELDLKTRRIINNDTLKEHYVPNENYDPNDPNKNNKLKKCTRTITNAGNKNDPNSYKKFVYCFKCNKLQPKPTDVPSGWSF